MDNKENRNAVHNPQLSKLMAPYLHMAVLSILLNQFMQGTAQTDCVPQLPAFRDQGPYSPTLLVGIQALVPSYKITCNGTLVKWGISIERQGGHNIHLQVWRPLERFGSYSVVGTNTFNVKPLRDQKTIFLIPHSENRIPVQEGDVIGFHLENNESISNDFLIQYEPNVIGTSVFYRQISEPIQRINYYTLPVELLYVAPIIHVEIDTRIPDPPTTTPPTTAPPTTAPPTTTPPTTTRPTTAPPTTAPPTTAPPSTTETTTSDHSTPGVTTHQLTTAPQTTTFDHKPTTTTNPPTLLPTTDDSHITTNPTVTTERVTTTLDYSTTPTTTSPTTTTDTDTTTDYSDTEGTSTSIDDNTTTMHSSTGSQTTTDMSTTIDKPNDNMLSLILTSTIAILLGVICITLTLVALVIGCKKRGNSNKQADGNERANTQKDSDSDDYEYIRAVIIRPPQTPEPRTCVEVPLEDNPIYAHLPSCGSSAHEYETPILVTPRSTLQTLNGYDSPTTRFKHYNNRHEYANL